MPGGAAEYKRATMQSDLDYDWALKTAKRANPETCEGCGSELERANGF
jgi:hypothetical protein